VRFTDELDLQDLFDADNREAQHRVEWALGLLKRSATGEVQLMKEMRELGLARTVIPGRVPDPRLPRRRVDRGALRHPRPRRRRAAVPALRRAAHPPDLAVPAATRTPPTTPTGQPRRSSTTARCIVRSQKWGKAPFSSARICAQAVGPVLFAGWDANGEPVGMPWATPHIQVAATAEDQTENIWRALKPMIELGPLADVIPDTGLDRINLRGGGKIEPSAAPRLTRLGARITYFEADQPESMTQGQRRRKALRHPLAQRRRHGRPLVSDRQRPRPGEASVQQNLIEKPLPDVYIDYPEPLAGSWTNKRERRRILKHAYKGSPVGRHRPRRSRLRPPRRQGRPRPGRAVLRQPRRRRRRYTEAFGAGPGPGDITIADDPLFVQHLKNARKQELQVYDDQHRRMHTLAKESHDSRLKIDGAMGGGLSWEGRGDCIAAGKPRGRGNGAAFL
jgi:hypothetical protein